MRRLPLAFLFAPTVALAQPAESPPNQTVTAAIPDHVDIYFEYGSAQIPADEHAKLDRIAGLYQKARPRVMIVTGSTDPTGDRAQNLSLSLRRAQAVLHALVDRGLPEGRFEVVAKGQNDPPIEAEGPQPKDRLTVVTWKLAQAG